MNEKRAFARIPVQVTIQCLPMHYEIPIQNCIITDMSIAGIGMLLSSENIISHGMKVYMGLNLPLKTINAAVTISWARQLLKSRTYNWAAGGQLCDIGKLDKNLFFEFAWSQFNIVRGETEKKRFFFE